MLYCSNWFLAFGSAYQVQPPLPKLLSAKMGGHILTQRAWDIAFGIYVTAELNMEPALLYCSMCGAVDKAYTKDVLQRRYLAEDVEELQLMAQPRCNWKNLRYQITTWLVQYSVHQWIARMNDNTGVAPSFDSAFEEYARLRLQRGYPCVGYESYPARKTWVQRFMVRWSSSRASIVTHEASSSEEIVQKVPALKLNKKSLSPEISGSNSGDVFRPQKENLCFN